MGIKARVKQGIKVFRERRDMDFGDGRFFP